MGMPDKPCNIASLDKTFIEGGFQRTILKYISKDEAQYIIDELYSGAYDLYIGHKNNENSNLDSKIFFANPRDWL